MIEYNITIKQFTDILYKNKIIFDNHKYTTYSYNAFSAFDIARYYSGSTEIANNVETINELIINLKNTKTLIYIISDIINFNSFFTDLKMNDTGIILFNNEEAEIAFKLKYM